MVLKGAKEVVVVTYPVRWDILEDNTLEEGVSSANVAENLRKDGLTKIIELFFLCR